MIGFIKLHRQLLEWEWYTDNNVKSVFLHILLTANFKEKSWRGHTIKRGQTVTGRVELAKTLKMSEQEVRTALKKLVKTKEITIKSTNRFSIITLVNFEAYQDRHLDKQPTSNQQITSKQPTDNQQLTTPKEGKKVKKEVKNIADSFESFWNLYNYKKDKKKALAAWNRLSEAKRALATKAAPSYLKFLESSTISQAYASTWLNAERWNDDFKTEAQPKNNTGQSETIESYYKKHLKEAVLRSRNDYFKKLVVLYAEQQNKLLELKIQLNTKNPTLSTAFLFDFIHGLGSQRAGTKPERRTEKIKVFYSKLSDYNKNKGEMRALFTDYLKH